MVSMEKSANGTAPFTGTSLPRYKLVEQPLRPMLNHLSSIYYQAVHHLNDRQYPRHEGHSRSDEHEPSVTIEGYSSTSGPRPPSFSSDLLPRLP
jgi:hypothetical protein